MNLAKSLRSKERSFWGYFDFNDRSLMPAGKAFEPRGLHEPCRFDLHKSVPTSTKPRSKQKICLNSRLESVLYHIYFASNIPPKPGIFPISSRILFLLATDGEVPASGGKLPSEGATGATGSAGHKLDA